MKKPEFNMISIYPVEDIKEIYNYDGPFCGVKYDSERKVKVAREIAFFYAEIKPDSSWEEYYPSNEEMKEVVEIINRLVNLKKIRIAVPDDAFRFSLVVYYFMAVRRIYDFKSYKEMLRYKKEINKAIVALFD